MAQLTNAEKQRWADMKSDICSISDEEMDNYTKEQWETWLSDYKQYCLQGGTRPPHRPPVV